MRPWTSRGVRTNLADSKSAANLSTVFLIGTGLRRQIERAAQREPVRRRRIANSGECRSCEDATSCPHREPVPSASGIGSKKRRDHFVGGFRAVKLRRHITWSLPRPQPSVAIGAGLSVSVSVSAALSNGKPYFFGENPGQFGSCWDRQRFQGDACSVLNKFVYHSEMKKTL
jgi:hypothetical protein